MRLACLYALLDLSDTVRPIHLRAALALWRYCEASARFVSGESRADPLADELLELIRAAPDGLTEQEIRDHFQRHQKGAEIGRALRILAREWPGHSADPAFNRRPSRSEMDRCRDRSDRRGAAFVAFVA